MEGDAIFENPLSGRQFAALNGETFLHQRVGRRFQFALQLCHHLLANIALIGGAKQLSEKIVLTWIVWKYLLILLIGITGKHTLTMLHGFVHYTQYLFLDAETVVVQ